jgi:hypothetical protein
LSSFVRADERSALDIAKAMVQGGQAVDVEANVVSIATVILEKNPGFDNKREALEEALVKVLTSDEMITEMAIVYLDHFSRDELLELEKLMDHPVMEKWLQNMPTIMPRLAAAQSNYVQPAIINALQN